jgi:predicted phage terminase large subunit-like protein
MANLNLHGDVSKNEEILHMAYSDLIVFGKMFSPQDFLASATPEFHNEVGKLLLDKSIQQLGLVLPRDHAKSTLASTAVLHRLLFATKENPEFIAWIGEAQDQAIDNLGWMMNHIYSNPSIHYYFGDLEGTKWTKNEFTLTNGCRVIGKGTSQRLRGKKQNSTRYTGMVLDDFESELNTKTPEARQQIKNWVTAAVYPAIDFDKNGFLWCNGTIVHYDSFLNNLVRDSRAAEKNGEEFSWDILTYKAINPDGTPLWASRYPLKKLEEKKQFYIDSGTPAKFYQEYMNQAKSPEDEIFTEGDITDGLYKGYCKFDEEAQSWYIQFDDKSTKFVNIYIGVDPASTLGIRNDFSVIMVIGVTKDFDYYIIEYWRKRVLPMDCADEIFKIVKRYSPVKRVNIETIAYQEMLRDYVQKQSKARGLFIPGINKGIKGYGNQKKKDRLFEGLQPKFRQGAVHLKKDMHEFIGELLDFPKGSHDDCIDAFWLSTQFAKGNKSAGKANIKGKKGNDYRNPTRKAYDWLTGARR